MQATSPLEQVFKRDRGVVIAGVLAVAAIAWGYTLYVAQSNAGISMSMGMAAGNTRDWSGVDFSLMFVMWAVMMVAMMVPSAAPMILLFATVNRKRRERSGPFVSTGVFLSGYVVVWTVFAAVATLGNWGLHQASLLTSMMGESSNGYFGGGLLLAAGIFQWRRLKYVCLTQCRSPLSFLMSDWRRCGAQAEGLHQASLLTSMMGESSNGYFGGGLLLAAGIFQWRRLMKVAPAADALRLPDPVPQSA